MRHSVFMCYNIYHIFSYMNIISRSLTHHGCQMCGKIDMMDVHVESIIQIQTTVPKIFGVKSNLEFANKFLTLHRI